MATIEQAIADLTDFVNADIGKGTLHIESVYLALQALQKKQERSKGCEYCKHADIIAGKSSIDGEITADLRLDELEKESIDNE